MRVNSSRHFGVEGARQFLAGDLDANNVAMMAYSELTETHLPQRLFALLHDPQRFCGHGTTVLNAG